MHGTQHATHHATFFVCPHLNVRKLHNERLKRPMQGVFKLGLIFIPASLCNSTHWSEQSGSIYGRWALEVQRCVGPEWLYAYGWGLYFYGYVLTTTYPKSWHNHMPHASAVIQSAGVCLSTCKERWADKWEAFVGALARCVSKGATHWCVAPFDTHQ